MKSVCSYYDFRDGLFHVYEVKRAILTRLAIDNDFRMYACFYITYVCGFVCKFICDMLEPKG